MALMHLQALNIEINCAMKTLQKEQQELLMRPFIRDIEHIRSRRNRNLAAIIALCAACYMCFGIFANTKPGTFAGRRFMTSLRSWWDWSQFHNAACFLDNPVYDLHSVTEEDCEFCESYSEIITVHDDDGLIPRYLKQGRPILVRPKDEGIYEQRLFHNVQEFARLYLSTPGLTDYKPCIYSSNMKRRAHDHYNLLQQISHSDVDAYYAQWENCASQTAKVFRTMYTRPSFLPMNIQLTNSNWVMICNNYTGTYFKILSLDTPFIMLMSHTGTAVLDLRPTAVCGDMCPTLHVTLAETEILLLSSTDIWEVMYIPSCHSNETILIAVGGIFD